MRDAFTGSPQMHNHADTVDLNSVKKVHLTGKEHGLTAIIQSFIAESKIPGANLYQRNGKTPDEEKSSTIKKSES